MERRWFSFEEHHLMSLMNFGIVWRLFQDCCKVWMSWVLMSHISDFNVPPCEVLLWRKGAIRSELSSNILLWRVSLGSGLPLASLPFPSIFHNSKIFRYLNHEQRLKTNPTLSHHNNHTTSQNLSKKGSRRQFIMSKFSEIENTLHILGGQSGRSRLSS